MSKFCQNCGNMMNDTDKVCVKCGAAAPETQQAEPVYAGQQQAQQAAPQTQQAPAQPAYPQQPNAQPVNNGAPQAIAPAPKKGLSKGLIIGLSAGGAALLIIVIVLIAVFSGGQSSPKSAANKYFNAYKNLDAKKYCDVAYRSNFDISMTKEQHVAELQAEVNTRSPEEVAKQKEEAKSYKWTFINARKYTPQELAEWIGNHSTSYKDVDKVKEIQALTYSIMDPSSSSGVSTETLYAIKVGSKWYIYE